MNFTLDSEANFEPETATYGMAGVDVHFGGPFFGSLETRFNGDGLAVLLKLMWAWRYVDP